MADPATRTILHFLIFENVFSYIENMKKKLLKPLHFELRNYKKIVGKSKKIFFWGDNFDRLMH